MIDTPQTPEQQTPHAAQADWHTLPPWFERFQDRFVLSLLIIAGMVLNGLFFAHGIVADIERPFWEWGVFHILLFVTFFAAGTGITGVTLRASAAIGRSFRRGWEGVLPGVIYTVIAFGLFFPLEVWASVTIRSVTALQTPADRWLLEVIGHPELPISPTVIAVALAAPLTVLVWGLVTSPPAEEDHDAQLARVRARQEAKLLRTEYGARRNQARVAGWAAAAKGAAKELGMGAEEAAPALPQPQYEPPMEAFDIDFDRPPTGPGAPSARPRSSRTSAKTARPAVLRLAVPPEMREAAAQARRRGSNGGPVRTAAKASVEGKVRGVWRPGMTVGELEREAGISRSAAAKWHRVLRGERVDGAAAQ